MSHLPVDHHMRSVYRFLAGLAGLFVLVFGIIGTIRTAGDPLFSQTETTWVFGLRANLAFSLLSLVVGAIIVLGAFIGRNTARMINLGGGVIFLVAGMAMLTLLQSGANFLAFSMTNCVVSFVIGLVLLAAGLYGKSGATHSSVPGSGTRIREPEAHVG